LCSVTPSLRFAGGAGTVTGSKYLLRASGRQVLLECGLFQGLKALRLRNWPDPPFSPPEVDAVVHGYGERFPVTEGVEVEFRYAGHILGAATVTLDIGDVASRIRLAFSGDLGRWNPPILRDPEPIHEADVLLVESAYGNRTHGTDPDGELERIVRAAAGRSSFPLSRSAV